MAAMQRNPKKRTRAPVRPSRPGGRVRRHARLLYGIAAVFGAGIAVGALLGGWIARDDTPGAGVAIDRIRPALEVPVRAYRPPVRVTERNQPAPDSIEPQPDPPAEPAAAPPVAAVAESTPATAAEPPVAALPVEKRQPVTRLDTSKTAAWLANAVAAPAADGRPMIAIVIDDLGID